MLLLPTLLLYALGLLLTGIGSRLASRCATWCGALCGLPMWMVGGTLVAVCTALPQLVLAFLAAGMSVTALAVGTALAGAVTQLGLVLALCLLRCNVTVDRGELLRKCALLLVACGVVALFVRDGTLSYTGTGLLMGLFVLFVRETSFVFEIKIKYYIHQVVMQFLRRVLSLIKQILIDPIQFNSLELMLQILMKMIKQHDYLIKVRLFVIFLLFNEIDM